MNFKILLMFLICCMQTYPYNQKHVDTLTASLKSKKKDRQTNFSRCDFRGVGTVFKGVDFRGFELSGVLFDVISDIAMPQASLVKIPGQKSDLSKANFSGLQLYSTSFKGAILKGANFTNTDIAYANFTDADLTGVIGLETTKNSHLACFCGATMPDGTVANGLIWVSPPSKKYPKGKTFRTNCMLPPVSTK